MPTQKLGNGDVTEFVMVDDKWEIIKQEKSGEMSDFCLI